MQTHDDDVEKDSQTEEITSRDKWTQHPTGVDLAPFGGQRFVTLALESSLCVNSPICHCHWWVGVRKWHLACNRSCSTIHAAFLVGIFEENRTGLGLARVESPLVKMKQKV